ncbi:MAG: ATP phosphoribosyltransferase regulatory subunit [Clostridia bacterium]|nr:ATP phosphoribosyltransferase regulatory subunit [Clostridia bacterium]
MISQFCKDTAGERDFGALYRRLGYKRFRMSRFEEYSLYAENRSFLVSDRVITFNEPGGRLMALRPDVTLSIAKSCPDGGGIQKLYYNENVYRVDESSGEFREIMQSGLECMGDVDVYSVCEVLMLAARSLDMISADRVLDISDISILGAVLDDAGLRDGARKQALGLFEAKNAHGLRALYASCGADPEKAELACEISQMYGKPDALIPRLKEILPAAALPALGELEEINALLSEMGVGGVMLDFSIVNDMHYYNGLTFRGFVSGSPRAVLSGGRYDNLMSRLGKNAKAIGFAVYLDAIESIGRAPEWDVDVKLVYDGSVTPAQLIARVRELTDEGKSVRAVKGNAGEIRARETEYLGKGAAE